MQINLTICGVRELREHEGKGWTQVISIWEKDLEDNNGCRELIKAVAPRAELLFSFFRGHQ